MIKTYCDCCKSLIKDGELWRIRIERNNGCISDLQPYGKFDYDVCLKCATIARMAYESQTNTEVE